MDNEQQSSTRAALIALPFVSHDAQTDKINLWDPRPSGNWGADCQTGRQFAQVTIEHMARTGNPNLLGQIVQSIAASGQFGGIEVGFFAAIAIAATHEGKDAPGRGYGYDYGAK